MNDDPRMRGFSRRADVDDVAALIDDHVAPLAAEWAELLAAGGRVLAADMTARTDVPAFARAAMDGYAVIAEETFGATPTDLRTLRIVGESLPAAPASAAVEPGTCVRIMTGAPVPDGADAVVPVEQTRKEQTGQPAPKLREERRRDGDASVAITAPVTPGRHVGRVGEDIKRGTVVLKAGRRLRPQDLGALSSLGFPRVPVVRQPYVALIVTGNELLPAGSKPDGYKIVDAATPMLMQLVQRDGGKLLTGAIVRDEKEALREALSVAATRADCVLVSGGSSVGQEDHAPSLVRELGELSIHGVAMRPASPAGIGFVHQKPVFLLPGNPVSCLCAYDFFAGRAIRLLSGRHPNWPHTKVRMPLKQKIASQLGRTDYVRVRIENEQVVPLAIGGASILTSTVRAHGFVIVKKNAEGHAPGDPVDVRLY